MVGNTMTGVTNGVALLHGRGSFSTLPMISSNVLNTSSTAVVLDNVAAYLTSSNRGGPAEYVGSVAPTLAAPDGSIYVNQNGGVGTTLYLRAGGSWIAK